MQKEHSNIGYLLNKTALLLKWELSHKLAAHDITVPQWAVLRDLYAQEMLPEEQQRVTSAHVAERLLADRPTISGVIDRLSRSGYLTTEPNPSDRRSHLVRLTSQAQALIPQLEQHSYVTLDTALQGLDQQQIQQLTTSLLTMITNLEKSSHN